MNLFGLVMWLVMNLFGLVMQTEKNTPPEIGWTDGQTEVEQDD